MESAVLKILENHVRRAWDSGDHTEQWHNLPEVPNKAEIMPKEEYNYDPTSDKEEWNDYQKDPVYDPNLPKNIIDGPWSSKEDYISAHYQILREDAIAPLRSSVQCFRKNRNMDDDKTTCIYTHVHFKGFNLGPTGPAFRITFSTERAGKRIRWEQSKRLLPGTMVALSPATDMFNKVCKVAIVAGRPILGGLDQNPPQIDLFWGDHADAVFDPVEKYIMIEARNGYFEAYRHVLVGLQKLRTERFSLAKHIAGLDPDVGAPAYLEKHPILDLSSLAPQVADYSNSASKDEIDIFNVNVLEGFPKIAESGMDESQVSACKRMVTNKVAIVQGPPGTGKTFTSIAAIKVMLSNLQPEDPPMIIAAQTNHALDQLMNQLLASEKNVVRLGGRCDKENVNIIKRTLYELRMTTKDVPGGGKGLKDCRTALQHKINEIELLMSPLLAGTLLTDEILIKYRLITEAQKESLYENGWFETGGSEKVDDSRSTSISTWLGEGGLVPVPQTPQINLGLPIEEADLEFEQLQELEQELESAESPEDNLNGKVLPFLRSFTGRPSAAIDDRKIKRALSSRESLYDIPQSWRGPIYRYWEKQVNRECLVKLRSLLADYKSIVETTRITKWNCNIKLIRHLGTKLIGCTTTGLSKYRPLLAALEPRTLLIEEAAETLEGSVMAGMFDSLEHLILVGDHKQLQAYCNIGALESPPYNLNVSMFERLISNSIGFTMLNTQRRMIPDIRKLLCIEPEPFYPDLHDHPSVEDRVVNRAPVPGMAGRDTYFFHHTWPETRNSDLSRHNQDEAEMIAGLFHHLVLNGIKHSQITVLTFYNGQRKTILKELKKHPGLRANTYFNVFTVDSYQGEENDIILLSLVRSNEFLDIGFLESRNRLVVAISRARRGLYIFGNAITLTAAETNGDVVGRDALWTPLIKFMKHQGRFDLDGGFPITCVTHGTTLEIKEADEWLGLAGGCHRDCDGILPCGHNCSLKCHPFDHSMAFCRVACPRKLECGHGCSHLCGETCGCSLCEEGSKIIDESHDHRQPMSDSGKQAPHMLASQCKSEPGGFYNPMPRQSSLGALEKWRNWDAKKGDSEMAEIRLIEASKKMTALSELVYEDTWRPVSIENGVRSLSGPERKIIRRFDNDNTSRSQVPKTSTMHNASVGITKPPEKRKVSNIVSRMTGFGVSNVDPFSKLSTPGRTSTQTGHLIDLELADPSEYAATPTHLGHEQTRYGLTVNLMDKLTAIHSKFGSSRRVTPAVIPPIKASYLEAAQEEEDLIDLSDSGPPILGSSAPDFDPSAVIDGMLWTDDDYD